MPASCSARLEDLPDESTNRREWLVAAGPVPGPRSRELNAVGGVVTSRAVLADPPDVASMAEQMGYDTGTQRDGRRSSRSSS